MSQHAFLAVFPSLPRKPEVERGGFGRVLQICCIEGAVQLTVPVEPHKIRHARVAELADALDLGSSGLNRRGSNPLSRILSIIKAFRSSQIILTVVP